LFLEEEENPVKIWKFVVYYPVSGTIPTEGFGAQCFNHPPEVFW